MPVEKGKDTNGYFYRWGKHGKKYYFKKDSKSSKTLAYNKASLQGRAIKAHQSMYIKHGGGMKDYKYLYLKYKTKYLELQHGGINKFSLLSNAFNDGEYIPKQYTCEGDNIPIPLYWKNPPLNTNSYALIMDDPDAKLISGKVGIH
jgi:hypothetical protein